MITELVKALEMKKAALESELGNRKGESGDAFVETERRLASINDRSIKAYKTLWQSFIPPGPFPCPLCYVFDGTVSPLKTLLRVEDMEPLRCNKCGEVFEIPVELLYA
jgi:hypothetical protein